MKSGLTIARITLAALIALSVGVGTCLRADTGTGTPPIESFSAAETGAEGAAWARLEAANGVLYFGFDSLTTYDGARWRSYPIPNSSILRGLDFGRDGRLWAAAVDEIGYFDRDQGGWKFRSLRDRLPSEHAALGEVWHAYADGDGAFFLSANKVLRWDGTEFHVSEFAGGRHLRGFRLNGKIFVQHDPTGLYLLTPSGPERVLPASIIGTEPIFWLDQNAEGWNYLSVAGLFRLRNGVVSQVGEPASQFIRAHGPTTVIPLNGDKLAVGTMDAGLAIITRDGVLESVYGQAAGFGAVTTPLLVDRHGALWVTSKAGLFRVLLSGRSTLFDSSRGLPADPVEAIVESAHRVVAATSKGLFQFSPIAGSFVPLSTDVKGLLSALPVQHGVITAGYRGVTEIGPNGGTVIHATDHDVFAIARSREAASSYFIADGRDVLQIAAHQSSRLVVAKLPAAATSIAEDSVRRLWLGTK